MFDLPIKRVMSQSNFLTVAPEIAVAEAAKLMAKNNVGAVLVVAGGALLGIFTERDVVFRVVACGLDPATTALAQVMTAHPKTIGASQPFGLALLMMNENGFRHLPVMDGDKPVGIVSARKALDPDLEEFVSEAERRRQYSSLPH